MKRTLLVALLTVVSCAHAPPGADVAGALTLQASIVGRHLNVVTFDVQVRNDSPQPVRVPKHLNYFVRSVVRDSSGTVTRCGAIPGVTKRTESMVLRPGDHYECQPPGIALHKGAWDVWYELEIVTWKADPKVWAGRLESNRVAVVIK